ncbi:MAG: isoprenylcysteine carboxylmethyltransferase family protein [Acidobacteriota bacterium]|nr:isoprenylcysteine carboxylmethyltransferase family protein [Acidobacteriota bacterium]MDH3528674.1 isoprenylcysteine carboxylmethyltransferase family protein [Acidobacteriota bacterium]
MARSGRQVLQRIRVPLGFLFGALFLISAKPTYPLILVGFIIALFGLAIRAWASGHISKNQELAKSGPYAYTRNPLYLGSFILGVGFCLASGQLLLGIAFVALFMGIYLPVMSVEADELRSIFGAEYQEYEDKVHLFFPGFKPLKGDSKKFEMGLYLRYREYRASLGLGAVFLTLVAKAYFDL